MKRQTLAAVLYLVTLSSALHAAPQSFTYIDLLKRLTDLEYLATLPTKGDQCAQWSSYDRRSRYDETTGKYVNWDANGDGGGFIRKEGDKIVMAEMDGPGCIWRIWSAAPKEGHVRIYLDGAGEPAVDLPFIGYFDGKNAPFTRSALVNTVGRGCNNYTPIPYQKSCKVVADPDWGAYYHFNYESFPKGTQVPSFKRNLAPEELATLDEQNRILAQCACGSGREYKGGKTETTSIKAQPGHTAKVFSLSGPQAITCLRAKLDSPPDRDFLRELAIQIRWDGEKEPSVWAPLGDFFGSLSANNYRSLPMGHGGDEWWYFCWYMPFDKEAQIELINDGKVPRGVTLEVTHSPLPRPIQQWSRFHVKWHRDAMLPTEPERKIDWPIVKTQGPGRFVGVMLHVWNPHGGWWGEGDEKFFVDGEKFPSTFGTGSEDYFGYAWGDPALFQNAYHNQTHNDGNNRGHICVNRWHITDNIPFQTRFEGCIEKYFPNQRPTLYASTAYWYQAPGTSDPYRPVPITEREGYWSNLPPFRIAGAMEGEKLKILAKTGGTTQTQGMTGWDSQWSNDEQLWWTDAKPGDKLDLALPVDKSGNYKVIAQLTKARDYGIVQLYLDSQKLGEPIDLFSPDVVPTKPLALGTRELTAGEHKFSVEIVGANEKAEKSFMFGLDYIKLQAQ